MPLLRKQPVGSYKLWVSVWRQVSLLTYRISKCANIIGGQMVKILMAHTYYPVPDFPDYVGGAEFSQVSIAEGLVGKKNHEVSVLRGLPPGSKPKSWVSNGVKIYGLPIRRPYWLMDQRPRSAWQKAVWHFWDDFGPSPKDTSSLLRALAPDILQLGNIVGIGSALVPMARRRGIRTFQILHDYYYFCPRMTRFKGSEMCADTCTSCAALTTLRRRRLLKVDHTVAVSKYMSETCNKLEPSATDGTLYNGIAVPDNGNREAKENGTMKVGYIGRISPEKGIDALLQALPAHVTAILAGHGQEDYINTLKMKYTKNVEFVGQVNGPFEFLREIDLLVVPSLWDEPFGRVSIEAQMIGVPVVVSNRGGLPETVRNDVTGKIVEPTVENLRAAICFFRNDRTQLLIYGRAAKAWSMKFTFENMLDQVDESIQRLVR